MLKVKNIFRNADYISELSSSFYGNDDFDIKINNFIKDKKVISIQTHSFLSKNNPPTSMLVYTIVYEE